MGRRRPVDPVRETASAADFGDGDIVFSALTGLSRLTMDDAGLASLQRLLRCPGGVDVSPIERADIIFLLKSGNLRRGIGCIVLAAADPAQSGLEVGLKKKADKTEA
jgi:hypothetical protein